MGLAAQLRRSVVYPLWTFKDGSSLLRLLRQFERLQWASAAELAERQLAALRLVLDQAYRNTTHYRRAFDAAGFDPASLGSLAGLRAAPLLTKKDLRAVGDDLLADDRDRRLIEFKTGGSTGTSVRVFSDVAALYSGIAASHLCFRWAGWDLGEPIGRVWGNPPRPRTVKEYLHHALIQPVAWLDTIDLSEAAMERFVHDWRRVRPSLLHGHAHSLYELALYLRRHRVTAVRPRGIVSTSMMLMPGERAVIETVFGLRVTDLYGCEEVGLIGCECERHAGMHLNSLNLVVEILRDDGQPAAPGEVGQVVVTSLINRAMPIIRYRVEDRGALAAAPCPCGRGLPLLASLAGRDADFLVKRDGGLVQGISLIERTLTMIEGIAQMQIIQESLTDFRVNLVPDAAFGEAARERLVAELRAVFGVGIAVSVVPVARIAQEPSGKYRFSICRLRRRAGE